MGQRSQIYFRMNGKLVFARHYQFNCGLSMISRARHGIQLIYGMVSGSNVVKSLSSGEVLQIIRTFDSDFDIEKSVCVSTDIIAEYFLYSKALNMNNDIFNCQDNNDGQLFVEVDGCDVRYCFRGNWAYEDDGVANQILDAAEYLDWDLGPDWEKSLYFSERELADTKENIEAIGRFAARMSLDQLGDFLDGDCDYQKWAAMLSPQVTNH